MSSSVTIVLKNPATREEDVHVDIAISERVRDLKLRISQQYPDNPTPSDQKLIFAGKLLSDDSSLQDVFAQHDTTLPQVLHLVLRSSATSTSAHSSPAQRPSPNPATPNVTPFPRPTATANSPTPSPLPSATSPPPSAASPQDPLFLQQQLLQQQLQQQMLMGQQFQQQPYMAPQFDFNQAASYQAMQYPHMQAGMTAEAYAAALQQQQLQYMQMQYWQQLQMQQWAQLQGLSPQAQAGVQQTQAGQAGQAIPQPPMNNNNNNNNNNNIPAAPADNAPQAPPAMGGGAMGGFAAAADDDDVFDPYFKFKLLIKLAFLVFLLGQDATQGRLMVLVAVALVIFLYQAGFLRVGFRIQYNVGGVPQPPQGAPVPQPAAPAQQGNNDAHNVQPPADGADVPPPAPQQPEAPQTFMQTLGREFSNLVLGFVFSLFPQAAPAPPPPPPPQPAVDPAME